MIIACLFLSLSQEAISQPCVMRTVPFCAIGERVLGEVLESKLQLSLDDCQAWHLNEQFVVLE